MIITILPAILLLVLGDFGFANTTFGDADFGWFGTHVSVRVGVGGGLAFILAILIAMVLVSVAIVYQIGFVDKGWVPGAKRDVWIAAEKPSEKPGPRRAGQAPLRRRRAARGAARDVGGLPDVWLLPENVFVIVKQPPSGRVAAPHAGVPHGTAR